MGEPRAEGQHGDRKLGILGGVGWTSTAVYYEQLCRRGGRGARGVSSTPEMVIESLDLARAVSLLGTEGDEASWAAFDAYHRGALLRLQGAGAEVAVMASNTPHHRLAAIRRGVGIPVLDLFALLARRCAEARVSHALVLGTPTTLGSGVLHAAFAAAGVRSEIPQAVAQRNELAALIDALQKSETAGTAERIDALVRSCLRNDIENCAVVLACTELPLAFGAAGMHADFTPAGVRYLNSALVHVEAALRACRAASPA